MYYSFVIRRLYIHNFRCLENFDLPISGKSSALLIGKNGAGKSTVGFALEIFQRIARGTNRVKDLVTPEDIARGTPTDKDIARGDNGVPIRFEFEVELNSKVYAYSIAFEFPEGFKELRVLEEKFSVDGKPVYSRQLAQVHIVKTDTRAEAKFSIDWHLVALPIVQSPIAQSQIKNDPLSVFKDWLARMFILRPIPSLITGESKDETLQPNLHVTDFAAWFSGILAYAPAAYTTISEYLMQVMPDLDQIQNPKTGTNSRNLEVKFSNGQGSLDLPFKAISDGEKCFMICALVIASNEAYGPVFCFWDEPDNYLSLSEVGHFVMTLRKAFQSKGQFIATSHNPEAIGSFSDENTLYLYRKSHLEPTIVRPLSELRVSGDLNGDLISVLIRGDVER